MTSLDRCLQILDVLLRANDVNGVGLMERAIDEYLTAEKWRQAEALSDLKIAVEGAYAKNDFRDHTLDYVINRRRDFMVSGK